MATFSAQITDLVGGTIDQDACDQWAVDGAREIILQLPSLLEEKCSDKSTLSDSPTTLDLDTATIGKVLYCTRNNGSYDIPCRLVASQYAHLTDDSTSTNYYAVADDPAYFIRDNLVEIKPTPTGSQNGFVYHILYPSSINVDGVSAIASFPIECEHLLVLYVSTKQLLQFQSSMSSSFNSDITTAYTAVNTELDETQAICDKVDADLVLAKAEIVLAKAEAAELATNTDNSSDFATALTAINTELDKVDDIIVEASVEFDKVDNVIVEGSTEFDEAKNLSGAYDGAPFNTALGAIKTELDKADNNILIAYNKIVEYYTEIADLENGDLWDDTNKRFDEVKLSLENAMSLIGFTTAGDKYNGNYDLEANMADIDTELNNEDIELANSRMQQAQTQMNAVTTHLSTAKTAMEEIGLLTQKHHLPLGGVSFLLSTATGYIAQAQGYASEVSAYAGAMNAFIGTGNAYLQEASAIANNGNAYLSEAQAYVSQAGGYASEVSARSTFASAKSQAIQGHISTAQSYIASAGGFGTEVQTKIAIANGYIAEAGARLQADTAKYGWYGDQYAKLSAEYVKGLAALKGGAVAGGGA